MLFRTEPTGVIAISQPAHAWISGQLARAWIEHFNEPLLLAAEQHDLGWIDWETAPTFDPDTGRPHLFRAVGAALHAPMWAKGVERALESWGAHVALLLSRHGGVIYRRYNDRHRLAEADARAAQLFLETQAPKEAAWARQLGLTTEEMDKQSSLIACVDTLSLALCGELKAPLEVQSPLGALRLAENPVGGFAFTLSPWPFRVSRIEIEGEARALPDAGRFPDESAMRVWLEAPERLTFRASLTPG
jgi:hypothetical protein